MAPQANDDQSDNEARKEGKPADFISGRYRQGAAQYATDLRAIRPFNSISSTVKRVLSVRARVELRLESYPADKLSSSRTTTTQRTT